LTPLLPDISCFLPLFHIGCSRNRINPQSFGIISQSRGLRIKGPPRTLTAAFISRFLVILYPSEQGRAVCIVSAVTFVSLML
jgi:hypothetical protein